MMTLSTLLILLLIGGFFFLMMRGSGSGCCGGGHNHGGHGKKSPDNPHSHHDGKEASGPARSAKDPVCGMEVTVGKNNPESRYQGREFYFCSEHCREAFERDPDRFLPSN